MRKTIAKRLRALAFIQWDKGSKQQKLINPFKRAYRRVKEAYNRGELKQNTSAPKLSVS